MTIFGWSVLALVFVDELLTMAAFGVWGWAHDPAWLLVWLLPLAAMTAWFLLASPKARYGGPVVRPLAKLVIFGLGAAALYATGHTTAATAFLAFSAVINGLAMIPGVRELALQGDSSSM